MGWKSIHIYWGGQLLGLGWTQRLTAEAVVTAAIAVAAAEAAVAVAAAAAAAAAVVAAAAHYMFVTLLVLVPQSDTSLFGQSFSARLWQGKVQRHFGLQIIIVYRNISRTMDQ